MNLDLKNKEWKEFELGQIFVLSRGKRLIASDRKKGKIPYYSASSTNNGLTDFIKNPLFIEKNKIIVSTFCDAYYVSGEFTASDEITMLSNESINQYSGKFISRVIVSNQNKYAFGRKAFSERLEKQKIILPVNKNGEPDFEFMEAFMKQKEQEKFQEYDNYISIRIKDLKDFKTVEPIEEKKWAEFFLKDIFKEIQRGKRLKKADHQKGKMPYVSSTGSNNGVDGYVGNKEKVRIFSNCLTIANSGSVGACFYQPFKFVASDHVTKLKNDNFNEYTYKFISSLVSRLGIKYSFNREMNDTRIKKEKILLPTNDQNEPDYVYMENYMKQLEYKKLNEYMIKKEKLNANA